MSHILLSLLYLSYQHLIEVQSSCLSRKHREEDSGDRFTLEFCFFVDFGVFAVAAIRLPQETYSLHNSGASFSLILSS